MRNIPTPCSPAAARSICKKRAYCGLLSTAGVLRGRWPAFELDGLVVVAPSALVTSNNVWNMVYLLIGFLAVVVVTAVVRFVVRAVSSAILLLVLHVAPPVAAVLLVVLLLLVLKLSFFATISVVFTLAN